MKKLFLLVSLLIHSFFFSFPVYSQFSASEVRKNYRNAKANERGLERYKRYTSIGATVNAFNYFGDLAPWDGKLSTDISFTRPGFGLLATRRMTPRLSLRGSYTFGILRADDFSADPYHPSSTDRYRRNLHFRNEIHELGFTGIIDLFKNREDYTQRPWFNPYVFLGVAVFHHNPKAQVPFNQQNPGRNWVALRPLETEGKKYSSVQIAVPFGLGARFKLVERLDLSVEIGMRQLYFDYLDDVSNVYVDPGSLKSDDARMFASRSREAIAAGERKPREEFFVTRANTNVVDYVSSNGQTYQVFEGNLPGRRRGNPNDNDIYLVTSIQLSYIILPRVFRPKYRE